MLLALAAGCRWGLSGTMGAVYMFDIQHRRRGGAYGNPHDIVGNRAFMYNLFRQSSDLKRCGKRKEFGCACYVSRFSVLPPFSTAIMKAIDVSKRRNGYPTAIHRRGSYIIGSVRIAQRRLPKKSEGVSACCLHLRGIFLIATHGSINNMVL